MSFMLNMFGSTVAYVPDKGMSVAIVPEIPTAVATRIVTAVQSSCSEGTRKTYAAAWRRLTPSCATNSHATRFRRIDRCRGYLVDAANTRTEAGERAYATTTFET